MTPPFLYDLFVSREVGLSLTYSVSLLLATPIRSSYAFNDTDWLFRYSLRFTFGFVRNS